jgi:hypothetical protein
MDLATKNVELCNQLSEKKNKGKMKNILRSLKEYYAIVVSVAVDGMF